jgi:hypothetical protein
LHFYIIIIIIIIIIVYVNYINRKKMILTHMSITVKLLSSSRYKHAYAICSELHYKHNWLKKIPPVNLCPLK